ncbi:hypothetical protein BS47DRAFT_1487679 [Hydnum rufescens UP504]|uniref:Uncharacterized protein n=1 Tax=Hydnum rufescens UP504 TaxID=1448309 RepID=A0A9P6AQ79_9AGAM|nr:hypothetical protein BS47DRAFT_1487679 [Hydnum rufescens UP504]
MSRWRIRSCIPYSYESPPIHGWLGALPSVLCGWLPTPLTLRNDDSHGCFLRALIGPPIEEVAFCSVPGQFADGGDAFTLERFDCGIQPGASFTCHSSRRDSVPISQELDTVKFLNRFETQSESIIGKTQAPTRMTGLGVFLPSHHHRKSKPLFIPNPTKTPTLLEAPVPVPVPVPSSFVCRCNLADSSRSSWVSGSRHILVLREGSCR